MSPTEPDAGSESSPEFEQEIGADTRQYGERQQELARKRTERQQRVTVRESIKHGNEALVAGEYIRLARICRDRLVPALGVSLEALSVYHETLDETPLAWDSAALDQFLEDADTLMAVLATERSSLIEEGRHWTAGYQSPDTTAQRTIKRAFRSLESIAVAQGHVPGILSQTSRVLGHEMQIGLQWQAFDYETPPAVEIVNPEIHPPFSVSLGKPGNGKSTSLGTLGLDAYYDGQKVIDLLDFDELENGMWDVPMQDEDLIEHRRKIGLPGTFEESDREPPQIEILHPLCEGLCNGYVPYDTERGEYTVQPFVIPVSELDTDTLVALFPNLTDTREEWLITALEKLPNDDWTLSDLQDRILWTEADDGVKRRLHSSIETLKNMGFLGDTSDPHTLDWNRIFNDTDTITVFSCSLMDDKRWKLMVTAYLLEAIYEERQPEGIEYEPGEGLEVVQDSYPRANIVLRELQKVAPGQSILQASGTIAQLSQQLVSQMQKLGQERRHVDIGIYGDTQQWRQFNSRVRENVDRTLMFKNSVGIVERLFNKLTGRDHSEYAQSIEAFERGECAVIGSEWLSVEQPFAMPIKFAPPLCHNLDPETEPDGWNARVQYLECEEPREAPWSVQTRDITYAATKPGLDRNSPKGFESFLQDCLEFEAGNTEMRAARGAVWDAFHAYAEDNGITIPGGEAGSGGNQVFGKWLREWFPEDDGFKNGKTRGSTRQPAYLGIQLSETGKEYRDRRIEEREAADADADHDADAGEKAADT